MAAYPVGPADDCPLIRGNTADTRTGAVDLDCFRFPETPPSTDTNTLAYARATKSKLERNRLTSILLKHSDDTCTGELGRLTANEAVTNSSLSILNTGLSTVSTIVGGELAKSILSGGAAFIGASRDHINVHVYRNTIAQAVSQVITAERRRVHDDLRAKYASSPEDWSIDDAIRSVNEYHGQCSFYKGLELLLKAADNNEDLEAYRDARVQRTTLTRLDQEITRLTALSRTLSGDSKAEVDKLLGEFIVKRSKLGIDTPDDAVTDPVGGNVVVEVEASPDGRS